MRKEDAELAIKVRADEEQACAKRARLLGLRYLDARPLENSLSLVTGYLTKEEMYKHRLIPLQAPTQQDNFVFGITINTPQPVLRELRKRYPDVLLEFYLISDTGYRNFMLRHDPPKKIVYDDIKIAKEGDSDTIQEVSKTLEAVRSDDVLTYLVNQAYQLVASDIHIEPQYKNVRIRIRVDGALHAVANISHDKNRVLLASIASRANISTAEREAQTGHMNQVVRQADSKHEEEILNMRIETVPTVYGHDVVIRLFNFDTSLLNIQNLGLADFERKELEKIISHPHGMLMLVGPTGSGKSTTLYSILNALNETSRKILTLEDPVEFSIPGISQIPVATRSGDSFAEKLRSVMRLDPDVAMVGEIRDIDTAKTAVQASITGHLVLTTFHANDSAGALSRMIDMIGVNPIFSSAIRLIISQRLVRKLDPDSKEAYEPDSVMKKWIRDNLKDLPDHVEKPDLDHIKLYKPVPTNKNPFGYSGRTLVMEQMLITEEIQKYLRGEYKLADANTIQKTAQKQGMLTLLQDGILTVLRGETTIEEINRVI